MRQTFLIFIICFFLTSFARQNALDEECISWSFDHKLIWDYFKADPIVQNPFKANTSYRITYTSRFLIDTVEFNILAWFDKSKSWVKAGQKSDKLLKHEQLHFDVAELYARKLRMQTANSKFNIKTINTQYKKLSTEILNSCKIAQDKYDKETNHSEIELKQIEWEKKIEKELGRLKEYENPIVKILLKK